MHVVYARDHCQRLARCGVLLGRPSRGHNDRVVVRKFSRDTSDDGDVDFVIFVRFTESLAPPDEDVLGRLSVPEDQRERRRLAWPVTKKGGRMPAGFVPKVYIDERPDRYVPVIVNELRFPRFGMSWELSR
jgi:hypothetical protein